MPRQSVLEMPFAKVYPMLVQKALRKGRAEEEVHEVTSWLTGYSRLQIEDALNSQVTYGEFFEAAPAYNPDSALVNGKVCGVQVETIEDPLMKRVRQLDKLVDELAKGKPLEVIKR